MKVSGRLIAVFLFAFVKLPLLLAFLSGCMPYNPPFGQFIDDQLRKRREYEITFSTPPETVQRGEFLTVEVNSSKKADGVIYTLYLDDREILKVPGHLPQTISFLIPDDIETGQRKFTIKIEIKDLNYSADFMLTIPPPLTYTVTFDTQGGSGVSPITVNSGDTVIAPPNPTLSGSYFGGWYKEATCTNAYNFAAPVTGDITLYAKWNITYTATADGNAAATTTKIDFVFGAAVSGLTEADITIGGTPGVATKGTLTSTDGTHYSLDLTVTKMGAATVAINKGGIESGAKNITLYKGLANPASPDLSVKFGVTSTGTTSAQDVTDTFNAVHAYLSTNPAVTQTTTANPTEGIDADLATKIGYIALGDYIELESLSVVAYPEGQGELSGLTDRTRLRLIVVGINSFNEGQGGTYTGNGNGTSPHLVFQFKNNPVKRKMNSTDSNSFGGSYKNSEMRMYLTGNFLAGLSAAGVTSSVIWSPKRYVANGGQGSTGAEELEDKLWLPTEREMFGSSTHSNANESAANQARLVYYDGAEIRKKSGAMTNQRLASPDSASTSSFCGITLNGNPWTHVATQEDVGCAPAFCVK